MMMTETSRPQQATIALTYLSNGKNRTSPQAARNPYQGLIVKGADFFLTPDGQLINFRANGRNFNGALTSWVLFV